MRRSGLGDRVTPSVAAAAATGSGYSDENGTVRLPGAKCLHLWDAGSHCRCTVQRVVKSTAYGAFDAGNPTRRRLKRR